MSVVSTKRSSAEGNEVRTTRTAKIWEDEFGIIHAKILQGAELILKDAIENLDAMDKLSRNKSILLLSDMRLATSSSKEHRDYFALPRAAKAISVGAMLVKSPITKIMGNMFINFTKPPYLVKLFTSEKDAMAWLKTFLKNE